MNDHDDQAREFGEVKAKLDFILQRLEEYGHNQVEVLTRIAVIERWQDRINSAARGLGKLGALFLAVATLYTTTH